MSNEFNKIVIRNNDLPENMKGRSTLNNNANVSEVKSVSEISENAIAESGSTKTASTKTTRAGTAFKISTAVSQVTVTASAATVVAVVVVVAVASASAAAAPNALVTSAAVNYYDGSNVCVEFVLEDEEDELESFYAWIEDDEGSEIACEITAGDGVYLAEAALYEQSYGELYFVVYASSNDGWDGELYRGLITLPSAPDIGVEYEVAYNSESGELTINYEINGGNLLSGYTIYIYGQGGEVSSTVDYSAQTISATVADSESALYLVVDAQAVNGWTGEIYRDRITIPSEPDDEPVTPAEPTASDIGVEYTLSYNGDSGELVISYEVTDSNSELSNYTVQLTDGTAEVSSTIDETANTITATITDTTAELYIVISGEAVNGWYGELYNESVEIPTAPDIGIEYTLSYNGDSGELVVTFEVYDDNSELRDYSVQLTDGTDEINCTIDETANTITTTETSGTLYLVISGTALNGWYGELYNEIITIPTAPDIGIEYTLSYNGDSGELVISYEVTDTNSELSNYTVQLIDGTAEVNCTIDETAGTITTTETSGTLYLVISGTAVNGWYGELYNELIEIPAVPDIGVEYTLSYNGDSGELAISYEITDSNSELSNYTIQLTDGTAEVSSTIDETAGTITTTETSGALYLVISGTAVNGWYGELYNELIEIPTAPDIGVEYTLSYNGDSGELVLTFEVYDDNSELSDYSVQLTDGTAEVNCTIDETAKTITTTETSGTLYLVISGTAINGWYGELYNELITIPTAPDIGVEYTLSHNGDSGELVISYEITDSNSELSNYTIQLTDGTAEVSSTIDETAKTITTTETSGTLYLVISGTAVNGWYGELYNEVITIPTAPEVTVSEILDEGWYEEGGEIYMYVYFTGDTANVTFSYWFEDDYVNIIACEIEEETEEYVCVYAAFDGSIDFTLDERGRLNFVISATTADGWTGEIYREKFVIDPVAPDVEVTDVTVTSYSYDTTLTVQFTVEDINGEIASYEVWYSDYVGYSDCTLTQDGYTFTATADVSGLDTSGNLAVYVYCVTYDGWEGYLYGGNLTLPTAPDVEAEVLMDNMYESNSVIYVDITYTGDTSGISAYEYWFEDEDGNKFVFDLGDVADGSVSGSAEFSAEDTPALDAYGRMYFVIAVTTSDGWQGEIYREKVEIAYDGYLTYPELTGVTINYYETDIYTTMQISVYDTDYLLTALYITLTDANTSLDLASGELSVEIGVETDADGITTYYVSLYDTAITLLEDGTVKVYLLADLTVDDITTELVLADAYYTVTVN